MDGLVKTAWTNKKLGKAGEAYRNLKAKVDPSEIINQDEFDFIDDYLNSQGIHPQIIMTDDLNASGFYREQSGIRNSKKINSFLRKLNPNKKRDDMEYIDDLYDGSEHGLVFTNPTRTTLTHELGHAIDHKNNPTRFRIDSAGRAIRETTVPLAAVGTAAGTYLSNEGEAERNEMVRNSLSGAGIGGVVGGGLAGIGGAFVLRSENNANRHGDGLIRELYDPDLAEKYINQSRPLRRAALNTYKINNLRYLKNSLLGSTIGAAAGTGLAILDNKNRNGDDGAAQ